ncbi:MAG: 16S rRNA (cytidine(1402)-2'-O)-methyltransferase, partial [Salinivirgaceae bacterium]|nr:16S rRNA (cytidine(1402)-2'-O)-methyltransferase [Salinivirgaceae bacterium]
KKGRHKLMESLKTESRTMIFYESPHRLLKTLELFKETFGEDRKAAVCREISKIHEQTHRGTMVELIAYFTETDPRGEIVLVVNGAD